MRAVVIATGESTAMRSLNERYPTPLLPLLDRPFIQHVVECLVVLGVTEFDFILSHLPERVEQLLGDGRRWESTFTFHLSRDPSHPYNFLDLIGLQDDEQPVLLAHADRFPDLHILQTTLSACSGGSVVLYWQQAPEVHRRSAAHPESSGDRGELVWTGWARIPSRALKGLSGDLSESALASYLIMLARRNGELIEVPKPLSVQACDELLASQWAVLSKSFGGLMLHAKEADEGIWLSRNISLHPAARLCPPVYIGENCRIGDGVQVGPHAVIGSDCVLDARCTVVKSIVFPGSYVGEALELADVIIDKNRLINVRVGAAVPVVDDFILGSISGRHLRLWLGSLFSRGLAVALLTCTWPVLLLTALGLKVLRGKRVLHTAEVVRLPAASDEVTWRTFQLWSFCPHSRCPGIKELGNASGFHELMQHFLPALVNIAKGELHFVGALPRSPEEITALPQDWQALYLHTKAGIVTEAYVYHGPMPTDEEQYSAEVFYSVSAGVRHDCRLILGYFGRVLGGFLPVR